MRSFPLRRFAGFAFLLPLAAGNAFATCGGNPAVMPYHIRVGADVAHCQYQDIQSAIDAASDCPTIIEITREHLYTNQHLSIPGKADLTLQGWGDGVGCKDISSNNSLYKPPVSTDPLVTLDGSSSYGSVLYVTGNTNLKIRNLTLTRGNNSGSGQNHSPRLFWL